MTSGSRYAYKALMDNDHIYNKWGDQNSFSSYVRVLQVSSRKCFKLTQYSSPQTSKYRRHSCPTRRRMSKLAHTNRIERGSYVKQNVVMQDVLRMVCG